MKPRSNERLAVCNRVLDLLSARPKLEVRRGHVFIAWTLGHGKARGKGIARRWDGHDFYPTWHKIAPWGGTQSVAISQLIRWWRGQPVLPLASWEWWSSGTVKLLHTQDAVDILRDAGYPAVSACVLCGRTPTVGLDWWNLDGVSGPCCSGYSSDGCRQKREAAQ